MRLILSRHAKEQARERGVSIEQIKRTIQRGAKYLQGKKIVSGYIIEPLAKPNPQENNMHILMD